MEGLEITVLNYSELEPNKLRIDSEYFQRKYLLANLKIKTLKNCKFNDIIDVLTDYHANGSYENLNNNVKLLNIPEYAHMVRTTDLIKEDFETNIISITKHAYEFLNKTKIFGSEILINKIGSNTGQCFLMPEVNKPTSLGMNIFMIRLKKGFLASFYYIFLNSECGKRIIEQKINGAAPKSIDKESIREILIPIFSNNFQQQIDLQIKKSQLAKENSKKLYSQAENLLLTELDLKDWQPTKSITNRVSFSNSFLQTGRIDAEYYQPKYDELYSHLKKHEIKLLGSIVNMKKSIEPGSDAYQETGIPFVRVSNISKYGLSEPDIHLDRSVYEKNDLKPKKGTILLSKDASVGIAYKVEKDLDIITSGAILHLTIKDKDYLPDYLTLVLNSIIVSTQAERDAGGSIIQHWKPSEIEQVIIPKLPIEIQKQISSNIQQSFALKTQSKQLLELAKQAVEVAIEQGEEKAMELLNQSNI